jgi:outer membrane protein TolC
MRPKINLVGEVFRDQISSAGSDNVDRMLAQVALNVSWNIFDGWETTHRRLQNKAHQRRLRAEAEQLRAQQRIECKRLHRTRQLILKEIAISKRRMRLSKAQVKTAELTFNSGSLTLSQLMEAVNTQHQHNLQHTRLKINYLMNTIQLLSLYGQDPILED